MEVLALLLHRRPKMNVVPGEEGASLKQQELPPSCISVLTSAGLSDSSHYEELQQ